MPPVPPVCLCHPLPACAHCALHCRLAVDYDGSATDSSASMSYTLQHYANDGGWAVGWDAGGAVRLRGGAGVAKCGPPYS